MINYMKSPNSPDIPNSLNEHWMPFSSNKDFKKNPRIIVKAEGIYLKTHDGNTLIDGSSGLYCNPLGHCLLYTSPSPRDSDTSRMPSSA